MSQSTGVSPPSDVAVFERAFADDEDLANLSATARRILATSAALFYRRGAASTSIRDITAACALTPGALYKHFPSKTELLDLLVRHGHDRLEQRIAAARREAADDATAQFVAFVSAYVIAHLERPQLAQLVRREYRALPPERYQRAVRRRRRMRQQLAGILEQGETAGVFALDGGASAATGVAVMVLDMCSRTSEWYDPRRADPPDVLARRYVTAALRLAGAATL